MKITYLFVEMLNNALLIASGTPEYAMINDIAEDVAIRKRITPDTFAEFSKIFIKLLNVMLL